MQDDTFLHICTTCRDSALGDEARPGATLLAALTEADLPARIAGVECLGVCKRPCTLAIGAPGKWTYIFGDLPPDEGLETIKAYLPLYNEAPDGIVPFKQRPQGIKGKMVARLPPQGLTHEQDTRDDPDRLSRCWKDDPHSPCPAGCPRAPACADHQ